MLYSLQDVSILLHKRCVTNMLLQNDLHEIDATKKNERQKLSFPAALIIQVNQAYAIATRYFYASPVYRLVGGIMFLGGAVA